MTDYVALQRYLLFVHSSENEWSFTVADKKYRDLAASNKSTSQIICNDCGMVATSIGNEAAKSVGSTTSRYAVWVELDDVACVIRPRPHSKHEIISDKAADVVAKIGQIIKDEAGE